MTESDPYRSREAERFIGRNRAPRIHIKYEVPPESAQAKSRPGDLVRNHWPTNVAHAVYTPGPVEKLYAGLARSFAKKEFDAAVSFVDMVGFTERARGKPAQEVAAIAAPFLKAVIEAATKNKGFIDKTFGDEVMVVMPVFPDVSNPIDDVAWFIADAISQIEAGALNMAFRAGTAFGTVFLANIETPSHDEWSVFGNCVNGAKLLLTLPTRGQEPSPYRIILGALEDENPDFKESVRTWWQNASSGRSLRPLPRFEWHASNIDAGELKGVGRVWFMDSYVSLKNKV